jgi:hypothetical protein
MSLLRRESGARVGVYHSLARSCFDPPTYRESEIREAPQKKWRQQLESTKTAKNCYIQTQYHSTVRYSTKEKTREGTTTLTQSPREERRKKQPETATNKNKNTINTEY